MKLSILTFILALLSLQAFAKTANLPVVDYVDIERYQGKWFEVAKLPNWFQKGCSAAEANYKILGQTEISVLNTCIKKNGERKAAYAHGYVVDTQTNAKLEVVFENFASRILPRKWIKGDYWIIALDQDQYQYVMVGSPNRKYLWVLARSKNLDDSTYQSLLAKARSLGFDTSKMIKN